MSKKNLFVVHFKEPKSNNIISLKARNIGESHLGLGFICISNLVFEKSSLLVDPATENLERQFEHTEKLHLSLQHIISVEEVTEKHTAPYLVGDEQNNLSPFPKGH